MMVDDTLVMVNIAQVQIYTSADGDWIDIFIDNKKCYGGHSITPYMLLQLLAENGAAIDVQPLVEWADNQRTERLQKRLHLGESM